jgi:hypothetical protein
LGFTLAAVDVNGDRMANEDQLLTIEEAWKARVSIPFTRDYVKHTLFSEKKYG